MTWSQSCLGCLAGRGEGVDLGSNSSGRWGVMHHLAVRGRPQEAVSVGLASSQVAV